jgi:hypothetical protein
MKKSLKTFYLYSFVVFVVICISLVIKAFFIYEQSKFDASHDFIVAVGEQKKIRDVIAFHPEVPSIAILQLQDKSIPYNSLAKEYGITTNGYIFLADDEDISTDMTAFMWESILHSATWQSNLTIIDKIRLMLLAKSVVTNNKSVVQISLNNQTSDTGTVITTALTDQDISSENITIQVINATNVTGLGQRLGRILTNLGADVVDVSSAQNNQTQSTITYFGNSSYTLDWLQKFFGVTATKQSRQTIANIVVTIGTDKQKATNF